ncbi:hypothetical protein E2C01_090391 [Portunus trituberculatus]|uniref:Uncharacterized protein n=1 Tax=Portunus trituberculatus TaxID=210409 RepID=A0A5B7JGG3_PORTR|nr:hypothetical protein [Portunus trituberculatus]
MIKDTTAAARLTQTQQSPAIQRIPDPP